MDILRSLAQLKKGENAVIKSFGNLDLCNKLVEMGCLPGEVVSLSKTAPFGCPISISLSGHELSLRKEEAALILVELVP
jgi:ferrous iron transport protein A